MPVPKSHAFFRAHLVMAFVTQGRVRSVSLVTMLDALGKTISVRQKKSIKATCTNLARRGAENRQRQWQWPPGHSPTHALIVLIPVTLNPGRLVPVKISAFIFFTAGI